MKELFEVAKKELEGYTSNSLKERTRRRGAKSPLSMRVVFYNVFNERYNCSGLSISQYLGIDHTAGLHYKKLKDITMTFDDDYQLEYFKMKDIIINSVDKLNIIKLKNGQLFQDEVAERYKQYVLKCKNLGFHSITLSEYLIAHL